MLDSQPVNPVRTWIETSLASVDPRRSDCEVLPACKSKPARLTLSYDSAPERVPGSTPLLDTIRRRELPAPADAGRHTAALSDNQLEVSHPLAPALSLALLSMLLRPLPLIVREWFTED